MGAKVKLKLSKLRALIRESFGEELSTVEVGDMVDVDIGEDGHEGVRVVELVDDVHDASGSLPDDSDRLSGFGGPGFVGVLETGEEMVFSMNQIVPSSKSRYFFHTRD